jgi:hypothetical protein
MPWKAKGSGSSIADWIGIAAVAGKRMLFRLALVGMTVAAVQRVQAGSAVANDGHGHTVYSFGHPKSIAIKRALDMARSEGWTDARLVAYAASVIGAAPAVESWTRIWIGEDLVGYACPPCR